MGRLLTSGFELNSITAGVEFDTQTGSAFTVSNSGARTGTYCGRFYATSASYGYGVFTLPTFGAGRTYYFRAYFKLKTATSATTDILSFSAYSRYVYLALNTNNTISLYEYTGASRNLIGTSSALNADDTTWYCLEFSYSYTSKAVVARLDGVQFASGTASASFALTEFAIGGTYDQGLPQVTGEWRFDDCAVNDDQGSYQNSWPGSGKVICIRPDATGDSNTFATQVGGTAGATNNYTRVNEVTPDNATSYNGSNTANQEDLYNCGASGIGAGDTVNVVHVGYRYRRSASGTGPTVKLECIKTSGGTKAQSAGIIPNSTTWKTNANAAPRTTPLTLYLDPDNNAWTQSTLDSMQIGMICTQTTTPRCDVSTVWAYVDYTPSLSLKIFAGLAQLTSTTPDIVLQVIRALAGVADMASVTPSAVLAIIRVVAGIAEMASLTPDDVELLTGELVKIFAGTAAMQTNTTDAVLAVIRAMAGVASLQTVTPNVVLAITRALAGIASLQSTTPDAVLAVIHALAGTAALQSLTPDAAIAIIRSLAGAATITSATPDIILAVIRALAGTAPFTSITPDNVDLNIAGLIILAGIAAMQSNTPDANMAISRALSGLASLVSNTPDDVDLNLGEIITSILRLIRRRT
jgi:hypothetical protein